jgi:hypothetical protein
MKEYRGSGDKKVPHILTLGTRWRNGQLHAPAILPLVMDTVAKRKMCVNTGN